LGGFFVFTVEGLDLVGPIGPTLCRACGAFYGVLAGVAVELGAETAETFAESMVTWELVPFSC